MKKLLLAGAGADQPNRVNGDIDQPVHLPVRGPNRADSINRAARSSGARDGQAPAGRTGREGDELEVSTARARRGPAPPAPPSLTPLEAAGSQKSPVSGNPIATNLPSPPRPRQCQRDINLYADSEGDMQSRTAGNCLLLVLAGFWHKKETHIRVFSKQESLGAGWMQRTE